VRSAAKGIAHDNALAESINGLYTKELIKHNRPSDSVEQAEYTTAACVVWSQPPAAIPVQPDIPPAEPAHVKFSPANRPRTR
jgi:hypothetical protein